MSRKSNYFLIGLFVIAGVSFAVAGIVMLGAGAVFREYVLMETYFDESVQGLEVGSPVKNRGVQIGTVKEVKFASSEYMLGPSDPNFYTHGRYILIRMRIRRENARALFGGDMDREGSTALRRMIGNGLRVQLTPQGITGVSYLEVDYADPAAHPVMEIPWHPNTHYIPSVPSLITNLKSSGMSMMQRIAQLDIEGLVSRATVVIDTLTTTLQQAKVPEMAGEAKELLAEARDTNARLQELLGKEEVETAVEETGRAMRSTREAIDTARADLPEIMENLRRISANMAEVSEEMSRITGAGTLGATAGNIEKISGNLAKVSEDLPATTQGANRALARIERVIASQQADLDAITANLRAVSENLKVITANMKQSPAQALLGGPPPRFDPERPR